MAFYLCYIWLHIILSYIHPPIRPSILCEHFQCFNVACMQPKQTWVSASVSLEQIQMVSKEQTKCFFFFLWNCSKSRNMIIFRGGKKIAGLTGYWNWIAPLTGFWSPPPKVYRYPRWGEDGGSLDGRNIHCHYLEKVQVEGLWKQRSLQALYVTWSFMGRLPW